jgi:menaquinone-dependent protoporphyrinogen oxidase
MKVLLSAASKHGSTQEIGRAVAAVLRERGFDVREVRPVDLTHVDADAVILGSAVYAGRWLKEARELVERFGPELSTRPVWLFSSGPVGDPPKPEEEPVDVADLVATTRARGHKVFAGRIVKKELTFPERAIVKALKVPEGDFRDWDEIRSWAGEVADELAVTQSG